METDADFESRIDAEINNAPRRLSNRLFHYTSSESAIFGILSTGTLRLSPLESTNDLWESRPSYPGLSLHHDDADFDLAWPAWEEIDRHIRLHAKVACLTQDWELPSAVISPDAFRGWAHLSMWAHYGNAHSGICLEFDREELIGQFTAQTEGSGQSFHGAVRYVSHSAGHGLEGVDAGQIKAFGIDAVASIYAEDEKDAIFFRKHSDWSNESEYRMVHVNQSVLPTYIDISRAVTGVYLGESFPTSRLPALMAVLGDYPQVRIYKMAFQNRMLMCWPWEVYVASGGIEEDPPRLPPPTSSGDLRERTSALRAATKMAIAARATARESAALLLTRMHGWAESVGADADSWHSCTYDTMASAAAVPEHLRQRAPGVPGEQIHFESGYMCIVQHEPLDSYTFVASTAVQILDGGQCRLHAVIRLENRSPMGAVSQDEFWRNSITIPQSDSESALDVMIENLAVAMVGARAEFDSRRSGGSTTV